MSATTPSYSQTHRETSPELKPGESATVAWFGVAAIVSAAVIVLTAVATVLV
jgi:hypothetical protein